MSSKVNFGEGKNSEISLILNNKWNNTKEIFCDDNCKSQSSISNRYSE